MRAFIIALFSLCCFTATAQLDSIRIDNDFNCLVVVTSKSGSDPAFTITGNLQNTTGKFTPLADSLNVGDYVQAEYVLGITRFTATFEIDSILTAAGSNVTFRCQNVSGRAVANFPSGTHSIWRPTTARNFPRMSNGQTDEARIATFNQMGTILDSITMGGSGVSGGTDNFLTRYDGTTGIQNSGIEQVELSGGSRYDMDHSGATNSFGFVPSSLSYYFGQNAIAQNSDVIETDANTIGASVLKMNYSTGIGFYTSNGALASGTNINTNTYLRMIIRQDGNVGIGTASPVKPLHVIGESRFSGVIEAQNGFQVTGTNAVKLLTASARIYGDIGDVILESTSDDIILKAGSSGTERMKIDGSSGFVNIGAGTPAEALDVSGNTQTSGSFIAGAGTTTNNSFTTTGDEDTGISFPAAGQIAISNNNTESVRVDASGNVGVGLTSPSHILTIAATAATPNRLMRFGSFEFTEGANPSWTGQGIRVDGANRSIILKGAGSNETDDEVFNLTVGGGSASPDITHRTSGTVRDLLLENTGFNPTSGTAEYSTLEVIPHISQTGGANGVTRGLYVNPAIIAAADFRAFDTDAASGYAYYQSNAGATNYFAGDVGIGVDPTEKFHVYKDINDNVLGKFENPNAGSGAAVRFTLTTNATSAQIISNSSTNTALAGANGMSISNTADAPIAFFQAFTERLRIDAGGNVGIGTTSPAEALDVSGNTQTSGSFIAGAGTTTNNSFTTTGDEDTGISFPAAGQIAISNNNTESVRVNASGYVGIGTPTPENPLHILATSTGDEATVMVQNSSAGDAYYKYNVSGTSYATGIDRTNSDAFTISRGATVRSNRVMVVENGTGEIGIGGITNPAEALDVSGNTQTSGSFIAGAGTPTNNSFTTTGDEDTGISFPAAGQIAISNNNTESVRVNASGYVGIGTTAPDNILHVEATDYSFFNYTSALTSTIGSSMTLNHETSGNMADGFGASIKFGINDATATGYNPVAQITGYRDGLDTKGALGFLTGASGSIENMTLDGDGNLEVTGAVRTLDRFEIEDANNYITNDVSDNLQIVTGAGTEIGFNAAGGSVDLTVEDGKVGAGTTNPQNRLDVEGAMVIGAGYSGTETSHTNGLMVEGIVSIGTTDSDYELTIEDSGHTQIGVRTTNAALNAAILFENEADDNDSWMTRRDAGGNYVISHSTAQPFSAETKVIELSDTEVHIIQDLVLDVANDVRVMVGSGTPESAVAAGVGSTFHRTDGGSGTSYYVKESGTGNTGWVAK